MSPQQDPVETAIRATHRQMQDAATQLDAAAVYAHVLDTSTPPIAEDGVLQVSRAKAFESTRAGLSALSRLSYTYTHESITLISKDAALWVAEGTVNARLQDGREITAPFAETIVFVLNGGQWKVLHGHRSAPNAR
jgi:ketosteroid isomerase-like protein